MRILVFILLLAQFGCSTFNSTRNEPLKDVNFEQGYRLLNTRGRNFGDTLVMVAFSGGGTRAAAFSYGVLKALRDTPVFNDGHTVSLLSEVDSISSVSGGSFTAAYYGAFGDEIFTSYEKEFLKQSNQGALIASLFDPVFWWRSIFTGFDRTEMAVEYYDHEIFKGKTFKNIMEGNGPFIEINATDLGGGTRFSFSQAYFDLLCSDMSSFSVARAVTASSAVPIAFPPVVLKNYAGSCSLENDRFVRYVREHKSEHTRLQEIDNRIEAYNNPEKHPFIHLVDGGVSDNLGIRAITDRLELIAAGGVSAPDTQIPHKVLIITVDASVKPEKTVDESESKPSITDTIDAFSDAQFRLYNFETRLLLEKKIKDIKHYYESQGHEIDIYHADISFSSVKTKSMKSYLNQLPTALELDESQVDILTGMGESLLRDNAAFKNFLSAMHPYQLNPARSLRYKAGTKASKAALPSEVLPPKHPGTPEVD